MAWRGANRLGDQAELLQHGDAVVETDLLADAAVFDLEGGGAGQTHRLASAGRQRADWHVVERVARLGAAADCGERPGSGTSGGPVVLHRVGLPDEPVVDELGGAGGAGADAAGARGSGRGDDKCGF
jgi:hypothetical protein